MHIYIHYKIPNQSATSYYSNIYSTCSSMMIIKSVSHSPLLVELNLDRNCSLSSPSFKICCNFRNYESIPKPPKRYALTVNKFDRMHPDPPLIQRFENELSDYCTGLEGDDCCSCWEAYLELKELERKIPESEIESLITRADRMKPLINSIHRASNDYKSGKNMNNGPVTKAVKREEEMRKKVGETEIEREERCPVPDGIPKSAEEMEEEERWRMPETAETRMLRAIGGFPSWYVARPDHETD